MKSSFHSLILFLPLFCKCNLRRLDSIQFNSSAPKRIYWQAGVSNSTRLRLLRWSLLYNHYARTTQKIQPLYFLEDVFTAPFHSNGSYSIVACVFVAAGMCLPGHCLAMNIYSDFDNTGFRASCHSKFSVFWALMLYIPVDIYRFGGTFSIHLRVSFVNDVLDCMVSHTRRRKTSQ
jgi:hypothetical protein